METTLVAITSLSVLVPHRSHQSRKAGVSRYRTNIDHLLGLLLSIGLDSTLESLAMIMLRLGLSLSLLVPSQSSNSAANSSRDTVRNASAEVVDLACSFLSLPLLVPVILR